MKTDATIIPIAAGKGGVGKTFLAANLAMALAELGHRTIAVDLDLGGCNLHSFLGLPNRFPGIGDFLKARSAELADLLVPTQTPHLSFLPGDGKTPFMANIAYSQKVKLLNHINKLRADYIIMDLGAGSSFNTLDFFGLRPFGLLVTTPEPTAVMGMLVFLKNYLLRAIDREMGRNYPVRNLLRDLYKLPMNAQMPSIREVHQRIAAEDSEAGERVNRICQRCRPRVVFNMGEHPDDSKMAFNISQTLGEVLSIKADFFGFIFKDKAVLSSIRKRLPFLLHYGKSPAAENFRRIADRIVKYWDCSVKDSAALICQNALQNSVTCVHP